MINDTTFSTDDTALYTSWRPETEDGVIVMHIPGVGELKMTLPKAKEISRDLARQAEYGRWFAMEKRHDEMSPIEEANKANRRVYPGT